MKTKRHIYLINKVLNLNIMKNKFVTLLKGELLIWAILGIIALVITIINL